MCVVCGCSGKSEIHEPHHEHGHEHGHKHTHTEPGVMAVNPVNGDLHFGAGAAKVSVPGMSQERAIKLEQDVLGENNRHARHNREHFSGHGILALNLVSSPGSGKTTLLCATIRALQQRTASLALAVIEGDQQTSHDADRIRETGAPAIQINTGKGCHLDAQMVGEAFARLPLHDHAHHDHAAQTHADAHEHGHEHAHQHDDHAHSHHYHHADHAHGGGVLFIENVGNLVCPAMWDLGEAAKVAILSVTEGEDKPLKYPDMFAAARLMILNKTDLLPHLDFDVTRCIDYARRVNPGIEVIELSARTGQGMQAWLDWILEEHHVLSHHQHTHETAVDDVSVRIAQLEKELQSLRQRLSEAG